MALSSSPRRVVSASRLVAFTQCGFKPRIEAFRDAGAFEALQLGPVEALDDARGRAAAGDDFEARLLELIKERVEARGAQFVHLVGGDLPKKLEGGIAANLDKTIAAMHAGAHVIAQAPLAADLDGEPWHGIADLLVRVDIAAPTLGIDWRYEVVDIKLARNASAAHLIQLALYAELIDTIQGPWPVDAPRGEHVGLITGGTRTGDILDPDNHDIEWHARASIAALGRLLRRRYTTDFADAEDLAHECASGRDAQLEDVWAHRYPVPVDHCANCDFVTACAARRDSDEHASLVARLSQSQRDGISAAGIAGSAPLNELTMQDIATLAFDGDNDADVLTHLRDFVQSAYADGVTGISVPGLYRARKQAALQRKERESGEPQLELIDASEHEWPDLRGFARLPEPSRFDLFLDLEGYPNGGIAEAPLIEDEDPSVQPAPGIDYLWGITSVADLERGILWRDTIEPDPPSPTTHANIPHAQFLGGAPEQPSKQPQWDAWWAHTPDAERTALEGVIDHIVSVRKQAIATDETAAHVYHYGHYEVTRLKQLTSRYRTRETELTQLLREGVFVNLYDVARDVVRIGAPSYSIKDLEAHYRPAKRAGTLGSGVSAMVFYRQWLETPESLRNDDHEHLLREIAHYNRDDCVSTWQLREWLLSLAHAKTWPPRAHEEERAETEQNDRRVRMSEVADELIARIDPHPQTEAELLDLDQEDQIRWHVAGLLRFHRTESNTEWWDFFARIEMDDDQRFRDQSTLTGLKLKDVPRVNEDGSVSATYTVPRQPARDRDLKHLRILDVDATPSFSSEFSSENWELTLAISTRKAAEIGETAAIDALTQVRAAHAAISTINTDKLDDRLLEIGEQLLVGDLTDRAIRAVLRRELPRAGQQANAPLIDKAQNVTEQLVERAYALDESYLAIQGPPGTGKTYSSAHMICAIIKNHRDAQARGENPQRVGVMGPSNAVVDHLLVSVAKTWNELYPDEAPLQVLRKKGSSHTETSLVRLGEKFAEHGAIFAFNGDNAAAGKWAVGRSRDYKGVQFDIIGGTSWLFAHPDFAAPITTVTGTEKPLSHLFVDEAGQLTMGALLPAISAADNIVLVGDPQQLPQVTKGSHPVGVNDSALRHLMGPVNTIDERHGTLLDVTRRMHPAICDYVSTITYEGQLSPSRLPGECDTSAQLVAEPPEIIGIEAGCVWHPLDHTTCSTKSAEEATAVVEIVRALKGKQAVDQYGTEYTIEPKHFVIIAPYNDQVELLKESLHAEGVEEVGTVDRFQGREAPIAIYSLTSSNRTRAPRGIGFLLHPNRMNVAVSRARTLSIIVGSKHLLDSAARSVEDVERLNALAAFVEA